MAYLDDQNGRPVQQKFLDLMALKPQLKEEVQNALHKLAEMKLRPEKIPEEEDVVKPLSCKNIKDFPYLDPVPSSMLHVDIRELSAVDIDWKMLTLDRPETQLDINIFSRMVYLDKLMVKCMVEEKEKKEREKFIRLRTKGRMKPPSDSDVDKSDEFTYEYFSRFYGSSDRAQAMDEVSKPAATDDSKSSRPAPPTDSQQASKAVVPPAKRRTKRLRLKKKPKRRKKKKKSKKAKLRKRKPLPPKSKTKLDKRVKKIRSLNPPPAPPPPLNKLKKTTKTPAVGKKKVSMSNADQKRKKKSDSSKTLIQMLKASEQEHKKKAPEGNSKS